MTHTYSDLYIAIISFELQRVPDLVLVRLTVAGEVLAVLKNCSKGFVRDCSGRLNGVPVDFAGILGDTGKGLAVARGDMCPQIAVGFVQMGEP